MISSIFQRAQRGTSPHFAEPDLGGARVLVTRPAHQAKALCALIENAGGQAVRFPTLEITDPTDATLLTQALALAPQADWAIFISPNAVERGLPKLRARQPAPTLRFAAVGAGSAHALHQAGIAEVLIPEKRFDSEGLLEQLPTARVTGCTVLLFRGEGGRALLANTLTARGARVVHALCYRRARPTTADPAALATLARGDIDIIVTTSVNGLENLVALVPASGKDVLCGTRLVVTSERQARAARALGFHAQINIATGADDHSLLTALRAGRRVQKNI